MPKPALAERLRRVLPAAWLGGLLGIALIAAPASFAVLPASDAGRVNGRIFVVEAWVGIVLAALLWMLERRRARSLASRGEGSVLSAEMILLGGTLLCTLLATYGVQPQLAAARAGQGMFSFGQLHAASVALFGVKTMLVAVLAWRSAAG